jgi:hypothetical protein
MRQLTRRVGTAGILTAALVLAACGDDKNDAPGAGAAPSPTPAPSVSPAVAAPGAPTPGPTARPTKTAKPKKTAKPTAVPTSTSVADVPTPTPKPAKLLYPVAMPDGRTAPQNADFSFSNLKLDQRFLGTTIATVDVTYKGPGTADAAFTAVTTYTTEDGNKQTVDLQGMITRIASGATVNVRLSGASNLPPRIKPGYSAKYQVTSVSDDDPAARTE